MLDEIHGLKNTHPIMFTTENSGAAIFLFESAGRFHLWDERNQVVYHITEPTLETEILNVIKDRGIGGLKLQRIDPIKGRKHEGSISHVEIISN